MKVRDGGGWMLEENWSNIPEFKMFQRERAWKSEQFSEENSFPREFHVGAHFVFPLENGFEFEIEHH